MVLLGPALAQAPRAAQGENLSAGKTPTQLFASDCSACHRSPAGLAKGRGPAQIANFLIEHYTSSRQSAGLLGAYVAGIRGPAPAAPRTQPPAGERPAAAAGPRPPAVVPDAEPSGGAALLQDERDAEPRPNPSANVNRPRPAPGVTRSRNQPAQAAQRPEAEPESRIEAPPPTPARKTLDTLEIYD
ncbi:MAG TPA: hypothetical protein VGD13_11695 [Xanthobacteraceae bacterium]|jgi:hypothetical protein